MWKLQRKHLRVYFCWHPWHPSSLRKQENSVNLTSPWAMPCLCLINGWLGESSVTTLATNLYCDVRIFFSTLTLWHTVLYCTITIYEPLTLQILQESIYNWTGFFFKWTPWTHEPHLPQGHQPSSWPRAGATGCAATRLEEPHQWEMPSVTETCFGTHLWSIEMSKCTGLQSE